jgi:prephenate dehydrogenase
MPIKVAIIGAAGRMGTWFVNYFSQQNSSILVFDTDTNPLKSLPPSAAIAASISKCVADADLVLVCVPVRITPKVIKECSLYMKPGAAIAEISSVKYKTFNALRRTRDDLVTLCLHPMFGPGATEKSQLKILIVPVRDERNELEKSRRFFTTAKILVMPSAREHDSAIAIVLGLTYFGNLAFSEFLSTKDRRLLDTVSGTTFRLQSLLAESILTDDPELISVLIKDNPYVRRHVKEYLASASEMLRLASNKDPGKLEARIRTLKERMHRQGDLQKSYNNLYAAVQAIE